MAASVRDAVADPRAWQLARSIVAGVPPRDEKSQAAALRAYVASHLHFVNDPAGVELLADPRALLDAIARQGFAQGDCDDAAVLSATLGLAIGIPADFVAGSPTESGPFLHVWTVLYPRETPASVIRVPVEMDTTRPDWVDGLPPFVRTIRQGVNL